MTDTRRDWDFGSFSIKSMLKDDGLVHWAVFDKNNNRLCLNSSETFDDAEKDAKNFISKKEETLISKRINGIPTASEYVEALTNVLTAKSKLWDMLKAHYHAPNKMMTSTQLAMSAGYKDFSAANSQYGTLGRKVSEFINFTPPGKYNDGRPLWLTALVIEGTENFEDDTRHWKHEMRPELAEALEILGNI